MSRNNLDAVVGRENAREILDEIQASVGEVQQLEQVGGGLVHYVYRVTTDEQTSYLKIRGNHYSGIPNIATLPELIGNEKKALDLFSQNSAEYFPEILLYNSALHYLLLSDVMPGAITLDNKYTQGSVNPDDLYYFGQALGSIHQHSNTTEPVRNPNDRAYQNNLLLYALESYQHPVLLDAATEHKDRETQLLVGDLSPKNTYIENGVVRLCDLENAHQGALVYDQAFAIAHILLHHEYAESAIASMWGFIEGYESVGGEIDQGDALLRSTLHGFLLYRLDNPVIPYELPFTPQRRKQITRNVFTGLDEQETDLEVIAAKIFRN